MEYSGFMQSLQAHGDCDTISAMYSDTHFHFKHFVSDLARTGTDEAAVYGADVLTKMAKNDVAFGLDIGTRCDDLMSRLASVQESLDLIDDVNVRAHAQKAIYFSAGIWPDPDEIRDRYACMETLRESIEEFRSEGGEFAKKLVAIGEGGLDHHWNPSGADGRDQADFDEELLWGERELFQMQLELAEELNLPFIVHSRDAFRETLECIRETGYDRGVIHCYSYGLSEAKAFLDRGWYIAFGGGTTYTKKAKMDDMIALLQYVPDDRILLETDSPYLAPVPLRGEINTPLNIRYTYEFIATRRNTTPSHLSKLVDKNIKELFKI